MLFIVEILVSCINILELLILIECILSWIMPHSTNEYINILKSITNPILEPFRNLQYKVLGELPVDISPMFAILALIFVRKLLYIIF